VVNVSSLASATNLAADTFIFDNHDPSGGTLYFDANGGSGADAVAMATLQGVQTLQPSDFFVGWIRPSLVRRTSGQDSRLT
jgi:hypothetical protein